MRTDAHNHRLDEGVLRQLLEMAPDAILTVDREGLILFANSRTEQLFGYPREELLGQTIEILLPEQLREIHRHHRQEYYRAPRTRPMGIGLELWARRKDGTEFPVEISLSPLDTEHGLLVSAAVRDITPRKRLEEGLRFLSEASRLLASAIDRDTVLQVTARLPVPRLADCCIVDVLGGDGRLQRVAISHKDSDLEARLQEALGEYAAEPGSDHPVWRVLRTGRACLSSRPDEAGLGGSSSQLRLLEALAARSYLCAPLVAGDRVLGTILLLSSEPGRYTEEELALGEELGRRAGVALDNARLYQELQAAIKTRNDFLAMITHDLKTPLATAGTYLQALRLRLATGGRGEDPGIEAILGNMERTIHQLADQVQELLDIARLQSGQELELARRPVSLAEIALQAVEDFRKTARGHQLRLKIDQPEPIGMWDAARLQRVVANLLSNAIKYSPEGRDVEVSVRLEGDANSGVGVLTVRDHGIGIPAAELRRVFDRFYRASNAKGSSGGTGMGLASAKQIVEQHGGTIEVDSREGSGSTFTVRLPLQG